MRLWTAILALSALTVVAPARAETDWFASLYTTEGVELRADERIFTLYALLNGLGYDEAPVVRAHPVPARELHPVRLRVRSGLKLEPALGDRFQAFFNAHPSPVETYGRYALALKGPAGFERLPQASAELKGLEPLLAEGFAQLKLADLFGSVQEDYRTALKAYHAVVDVPVNRARKALRLKDDDAPRVVLVVNLLDGHGRSYSYLSGDELWVVLGPAKTPDLFAVVRELARTRLSPLVAGKADAEAAPLVIETLAQSFAASSLGLPDAELEVRSKDLPGLKDWAKQVDAFAKTDKALEVFVAEAIPALLKELGKEPGKDPAKKPAGKK